MPNTRRYASDAFSNLYLNGPDKIRTCDLVLIRIYAAKPMRSTMPSSLDRGATSARMALALSRRARGTQ